MNTKKILIFSVTVLGLFFSGNAISQNIKLNPIKPGEKLTVSISDEQQAILAVRKAKASVVSVASYLQRSNGSQLPPTVETNYGTGFVWDTQGTVVTNSHVVNKPGATFSVILSDGSEYPAELAGLDKYNDVAILKTKLSNLPVATLGDSESLEAGQSVFAIGYSLGKYQSSVSRGVVSGLSRQVTAPSDSQIESNPRYTNLIQTDAAINPGNSGGPLINLLGEVVGMNTIIDRNGESLGFAVPVSVIKFSIEQLKKFGKVSRPYMGVQFLTVNKGVQIQNKLSVAEGAYIITVTPKSPADISGIKVDDVIIAINLQILNQFNELDGVVQKHWAGSQLLISLMRGKEKLELPLILGEYK